MLPTQKTQRTQQHQHQQVHWQGGAICKPPASKVTPPPSRTSRLDGDVKLRKLDKLTSVNLCRLNTLGSVVTESTMSSPRPSRDPAASCPAASED